MRANRQQSEITPIEPLAKIGKADGENPEVRRYTIVQKLRSYGVFARNSYCF